MARQKLSRGKRGRKSGDAPRPRKALARKRKSRKLPESEVATRRAQRELVRETERTLEEAGFPGLPSRSTTGRRRK